MDKQGLVTALRAFLPADSVLDQAEDLLPYECDGLSADAVDSDVAPHR